MKKINLIGILAALLCVSMASAATVNVIAVTNNTYLSDLGGLAGADQKCVDFATANGLNNPSGWKALIGSGTSPVRDKTQPGWVLQANTPYYRLDGTTLIDTTGSDACFTFNLDNSISTGGAVWTGLDFECGPQGDDCSGWTSNNPGDPEEEEFYGGYGITDQIATNALSAGGYSCGSQSLKIYCVGTVQTGGNYGQGEGVPEVSSSKSSLIAVTAIIAVAVILGVVLLKKK